MALINCKECKKEISDKAEKCPNCGVSLKKKEGCLWWYVLFGVLAFFAFIIYDTDSDSTNTTNTGTTSDYFLAYNYAEDAVKKELKSPSTAVFPSSSERYSHVNHIGGGEYEINSWVDSQNSFGALVRANFSVVIVITDSGVNYKNLKIN